MKTGSLFEQALTPAPGIIDIGKRKQHFLDDLLVDEASRFERSTRILESGVHQVCWDGADLSRLAGEPVRLRLEIRNACLYSIQFT